MAATVIDQVDVIAERATALGGYATGTVRMSAANSKLAEFPTSAIEGPDHIHALVERYASYANSTRAAIETAMNAGDQSTGDVFVEISRQSDKNLWFFEAHEQA